MHRHSLNGNREIPAPPSDAEAGGRTEKVTNRTSVMHGAGKSDGCVVPGKQANKRGPDLPCAELAEGRQPTLRNACNTTAPLTQSGTGATSGLQRVRETARRDKKVRFTTLLHHVTTDLLRESFLALKKKAAPGIDGVTWVQYADGLEARLDKLHTGVHKGTYRAQPSKRQYIPKADGKMRPLGIPTLKDRAMQGLVKLALEPEWEAVFEPHSFGFRPGRSVHGPRRRTRAPCRWRPCAASGLVWC